MTDDRPALTYQPALDGVRAVAVTLVVLFHLGLPWMRAGYLGVSVFFTLSGFLITSLLLHEFHRDGTVSFRRFYARRARRLLPAAMACLLLVVVARWSGEFALVPGLRADLFGALFQVFNWVQIAGGSSYAALFGRSAMFTSPLEHYWSLAIEEQFYLVWPVVLVALCGWRARRGRSVVRPLLVLTVLFAAAAPLIGWKWGAGAAYWSTPSRLGELLVGALAAAWLHTAPIRTSVGEVVGARGTVGDRRVQHDVPVGFRSGVHRLAHTVRTRVGGARGGSAGAGGHPFAALAWGRWCGWDERATGSTWCTGRCSCSFGSTAGTSPPGPGLSWRSASPWPSPPRRTGWWKCPCGERRGRRR